MRHAARAHILACIALSTAFAFVLPAHAAPDPTAKFPCPVTNERACAQHADCMASETGEKCLGAALMVGGHMQVADKSEAEQLAVADKYRWRGCKLRPAGSVDCIQMVRRIESGPANKHKSRAEEACSALTKWAKEDATRFEVHRQKACELLAQLKSAPPPSAVAAPTPAPAPPPPPPPVKLATQGELRAAKFDPLSKFACALSAGNCAAHDRCLAATDGEVCYKSATDMGLLFLKITRDGRELNEEEVEELMAKERLVEQRYYARGCALGHIRSCEKNGGYERDPKLAVQILEEGCALGQAQAKKEAAAGAVTHNTEARTKDICATLARARRRAEPKKPVVYKNVGDVAATLQLVADKKKNLAGVDLSGKKLEGIDLTGVDLRGANLDKAIMNAAKLDGADLTGASLLGTELLAASFKGARADGLKAKGSRGFDFTGIASMKDSEFEGGSVTGDFRGCVLYEVSFSDTHVFDANLTGVDLRKVYLTGADLGGAMLKGANLSGHNMMSRASFNGANLSGANLSGAHLSDNTFKGTDLRGANLRGSFFFDGTVEKAKLDGADLSGCEWARIEAIDSHWGNANVTGGKFKLIGFCYTDVEKNRTLTGALSCNACTCAK